MKITYSGKREKSFRTMLVRAGVNVESFDVSAHIDRKLTRSENTRNLKKLARVSSNQGKSWREQIKDPYAQTGTSNKKHDQRYLAQKPGWRKTRGSKRGGYWEYRANRSDRSRARRL